MKCKNHRIYTITNQKFLNKYNTFKNSIDFNKQIKSINNHKNMTLLLD